MEYPRLKWQRTWPDETRTISRQDYVFRMDGIAPNSDYARIYISLASNNPEMRWAWAVCAAPITMEGGHCRTKQEAADKATEAFWRVREKEGRGFHEGGA